MKEEDKIDSEEMSNMIDNVSLIFNNVFGMDNIYSFDEIKNKFCYDIDLPISVRDNINGEETWTAKKNMKKYISLSNMEKHDEVKGWMLEKRDIKNLNDIISIWDKINFITTERVYDSLNVFKSDTIYSSENIYNSRDCRGCKSMFFCDGCGDCEYLIGCRRSSISNNCIRIEDSATCSNSYNVTCSSKIVNSFFIQDCNSLFECMFCSHIANQRYCISNMQFEKEEYFKIKDVIVKWILSK